MLPASHFFGDAFSAAQLLPPPDSAPVQASSERAKRRKGEGEKGSLTLEDGTASGAQAAACQPAQRRSAARGCESVPEILQSPTPEPAAACLNGKTGHSASLCPGACGAWIVAPFDGAGTGTCPRILPPGFCPRILPLLFAVTVIHARGDHPEVPLHVLAGDFRILAAKRHGQLTAASSTASRGRPPHDFPSPPAGELAAGPPDAAKQVQPRLREAPGALKAERQSPVQHLAEQISLPNLQDGAVSSALSSLRARTSLRPAPATPRGRAGEGQRDGGTACAGSGCMGAAKRPDTAGGAKRFRALLPRIHGRFLRPERPCGQGLPPLPFPALRSMLSPKGCLPPSLSFVPASGHALPAGFGEAEEGLRAPRNAPCLSAAPRPQ